MVYFKPKHEQLVIDWQNANQKQQVKIYNELKPVFDQMTYSIMYRYFQFSPSRYEEIICDTVNHLFLNLHKFNPDSGKAYSYTQTVIKNYLNDIIRNKTQKKNLEFQCIEHEILVLLSDKQIEEEQEYSSIENFIKILNKKRQELIALNKPNKKSEIDFLFHSSEYLLLYSGNTDTSAIHEYCVEKSGLCDRTIGGFMSKYFGVNTSMSVEYSVKTEQRIVQEFGIIDDDYTPNQPLPTRINHREFLRKQKNNFIF